MTHAPTEAPTPPEKTEPRLNQSEKESLQALAATGLALGFVLLANLPETQSWAGGWLRWPVLGVAAIGIVVCGLAMASFATDAADGWLYWHAVWTTATLTLPALGSLVIAGLAPRWAAGVLAAFVFFVLARAPYKRFEDRHSQFWVGWTVSRRDQLRSHWGWAAASIAVLAALSAICILLLPELRFVPQLWVAWVGTLCAIYSFAVLRLGYLSFRYRLDQDLREVGVSLRGPLERMRRELSATQEQLRTLADELGASLMELDSMDAKTQELETRARDAEQLASLNSELQSAFLRNLERKWRTQNVHQFGYFFAGALLALALAFSREIAELAISGHDWFVSAFS